jgi:thiol-disulfide isomerase/thioredoxin
MAAAAISFAVPTAGPAVARPWPANLPAIRGANGAAISPHSLRGKFVIVNFWASWCVPCRTELPSLERLAAHNHARLEVIAVSVDASPADAWRAFGNHYPHLRLAFASLPSVLNFGALGMPYSVIRDSTGAERKRVGRALEWSGAQGAAALSQAGFNMAGKRPNRGS